MLRTICYIEDSELKTVQYTGYEILELVAHKYVPKGIPYKIVNIAKDLCLIENIDFSTSTGIGTK